MIQAVLVRLPSTISVTNPVTDKKGNSRRKDVKKVILMMMMED